MKIKAFPNASGSGQWRIIHPLKYLARQGHEIDIRPCAEDTKTPVEELIGYDIIIPQGVIDLEALQLILSIKRDYGTKIILDFDDMIKVTKDNPHYKDHKIWDASPILQSFCKFVDGITTTNEYLAKKLRKLNKNVFIFPNYMDMEVWQMPIRKNETDKVRIGYVGSVTHLSDVKSIINPLKKILTKYKDKVELVMVGDLRWKEFFKGFNNVDCMLGVPFDLYPSRLNGLMMDIGIAPLRDNDFNRCKSYIKWMENTIAGGVTVASPCVYKDVIEHGKNGFIANNNKEWEEYLELLINDSELRKRVHSRAYSELISKHSLSSNIGKLESIYQTILKKC